MKVFNIKQLRFDLGVPQHVLADALNLPQSSISAMEKGRTRVAKKHIDTLAEKFSFSPEKYMMDEKESNNPKAATTPDSTSPLSDTQLLNLVEKLQQNILSYSESLHEKETSRFDELLSQHHKLNEERSALQNELSSLQKKYLEIQEQNYQLKLILAKNGINY